MHVIQAKLDEQLKIKLDALNGNVFLQSRKGHSCERAPRV